MKTKLIVPTAAECEAFGHGGGFPPKDNFADKFRFVGKFHAKVFNDNGELIDERIKHNLIVDVGFQLIADSLGDASTRPNVISHIGVGTGTTAAAAGQTALVTQVVRVAGVYSYAAKVITFTADFAAGVGSGALTEAGVFNASSSGIMLNRVVFPVINKGASDTMTVTFTFTMS